MKKLFGAGKEPATSNDKPRLGDGNKGIIMPGQERMGNDPPTAETSTETSDSTEDKPAVSVSDGEVYASFAQVFNTWEEGLKNKNAERRASSPQWPLVSTVSHLRTTVKEQVKEFMTAARKGTITIGESYLGNPFLIPVASFGVYREALEERFLVGDPKDKKDELKDDWFAGGWGNVSLEAVQAGGDGKPTEVEVAQGKKVPAKSVRLKVGYGC